MGVLIHADDILIASSMHELKQMLYLTHQYMCEHRMRLSTTKCYFMVVQSKRMKGECVITVAHTSPSHCHPTLSP